MKSISQIKKDLRQELKRATVPVGWSSWQKKSRSSGSFGRIALSVWRDNIKVDGSKVVIYNLASAPPSLRKKYLRFYSSHEYLSRIILSQAVNHFIIELTTRGKIEVNWLNKISCQQSVLWLIKGEGEVVITEKQHSFFGSQRLMIYSPRAKVKYILLKKQASGQSLLDYQGSARRLQWYAAIRNYGQLAVNFSSSYQQVEREGGQYLALRAGRSSRTILTMSANHQSRQTQSVIKLKAVAEDKASIFAEGKLTIVPRGVYTDSYLHEDILLLSDQARARAVPKLEIANNEVRASHAATVGRLDPNSLFYLQSRGLDNRQARELLVKAHLQSIWEKKSVLEYQAAFTRILLGNLNQ